MKAIRKGVLVGSALLASLMASSASAQVQPMATEAQRAPNRAALYVAPVAVPPGSWTRGRGEHMFTACKSGCDLNASPGQSVPLTIEVWGGGGGGGSGEPTFAGPGDGGGGGGGGGYGKRTIAVVIPTGMPTVYRVKVGAGGAGFQPNINSGVAGAPGGATEVSTTNLGALVRATGGQGGNTSWPGCARCGGSAGTGTMNSWGGTAGQAGGLPNNCNGGPGGAGGAGGGPGRTGPGYVNDGGNGGAGGYARNPPKCRGDDNDGLQAGSKGGDGKVVLSW